MKEHPLVRPFTQITKLQLTIFISAFAILGVVLIIISFASSPTLIGDENSDGVVNVLDLSILLANWHTNNASVDLNSNGYIDIADLSILLSAWGKTANTSGAPSVTFAVSPSGIVSGDSATLAWSSQNTSACSISPNIGAVPTSGTHDSGAITTTTTFTISCTGTAGSTSAQTTLLVASAGGSTANATVNFGSVIQQVTKQSFAMDESGYPGGGPVLGNDATEQQQFKKLGVGMIRMGLKYVTSGDPTSGIVCNGSGCDVGISGDQYIQAIRAMGADPIIIVPWQSPTDAANLVKHYNIDLGYGIKRWIVGNETAGGSAVYSPAFDAAYTAMKAVDPTILVGGPATADFYCCTATSFLSQFLDAEGSKVDFIDFHTYSESYPGSGKTDAQILTLHYLTKVNTLRDLITQKQPNRNIAVEVGEYNMDTANADPRMAQQIEVLWQALVLGKILTGGGLAMPYTTKNGLIGLVDGSDKPTAGYHGYGMYTGEGLFRGFGTQLVQSGTDDTDIETFASSNSQNIVAVNKNTGTSIATTFSLSGTSALTADVWLKDTSVAPNAAPYKAGTVNIVNGKFTYTLPAYSVVTFVLN